MTTTDLIIRAIVDYLEHRRDTLDGDVDLRSVNVLVRLNKYRQVEWVSLRPESQRDVR